MAGAVLTLADFVVPGLIACVLGFGCLAWRWLTSRQRVTPVPETQRGVLEERRRRLREQIAQRREADLRYEEDTRRCERATSAVCEAASSAGFTLGEPEALVVALVEWRKRRDDRLSRLRRRCALWDELQQALAGADRVAIRAEAIRLRDEAATLAQRVDPMALAAARDASQERLAARVSEAVSARDAFLAARGQLEQLATDLPRVADAEDDMAAAECELGRVQRLFRTLSTTIEFLKRAEERVHRNIAPVISATVLEWLPAVTGKRYTDCKLDPKSLQVEVRSGNSPWRRAALLSHGTAEQVYLLVRLALARHLVTDGELCPLILDDALAACDADRKHALLETLHAVSAETQVILFTHEEDVRAWTQQRLSAPRDRLTELPDPSAGWREG